MFIVIIIFILFLGILGSGLFILLADLDFMHLCHYDLDFSDTMWPDWGSLSDVTWSLSENPDAGRPPSPATSETFEWGSSSSSSSSSGSGGDSISFAEQLWRNRHVSGRDAKMLDYAKRMLLHKICDKYNVPQDIQACIQDNVWGNHYYEWYNRQPLRYRQNGWVIFDSVHPPL